MRRTFVTEIKCTFHTKIQTIVAGLSPFKEKYTHLFSFFNSADAADDNFVTSFKCDHLSNTIRGTGMIDISKEQNKEKIAAI